MYPTDRELARNVVNDLWDLFGVLSREQQQALQTYFEELTAKGILVYPQPPVSAAMKENANVGAPEASISQAK